MHEDTHDDEPLDIAPDDRPEGKGQPQARQLARHAHKLAAVADRLFHALNRGTGMLRRLADAMEADAITVAGVAADLRAAADVMEGACDG